MSNALRRAKRDGYSLLIYRSLLNLALLVSAFSAFPEHRFVIGLAVLVFSQGIAAIGVTVAVQAIAQNDLDDAGERKTRHTILLAAERGDSPGPTFWSDVDRRIAEERPIADEPSAWYLQVGAVVGRVTFLLVGDLVTIGIALVLAG